MMQWGFSLDCRAAIAAPGDDRTHTSLQGQSPKQSSPPRHCEAKPKQSRSCNDGEAFFSLDCRAAIAARNDDRTHTSLRGRSPKQSILHVIARAKPEAIQELQSINSMFFLFTFYFIFLSIN
jgi:hypothetical protein